MFVESQVEISMSDRSAFGLDDHELKLWVQRAFSGMSCYRIEGLQRQDRRRLTAVVAISTAVLPPQEREFLENRPEDFSALVNFIESQFDGKGNCRAVGKPMLKSS